MNRNVPAILFAIVFPTIVTLIYFVWLEDFSPAVKQIAYAIGKTIQFGFPIAWVWFFHREFLRRKKNGSDRVSEVAAINPQTGSSPQWPAARSYAVGSAFGLLVVGSMLGIYFFYLAESEFAAGLLDKVKDKTLGNGIDTPLKFLGLGIFYAICHSFMEEYYWRWFVFGQLKRLIPVAAANLISSLGFMAHHVILLSVFLGWNSPLAWIFSAAICVGGIFWAWLYQRSGSLKAPWLSHLIVDAGIFTLGYLMIRHLFAG